MDYSQTACVTLNPDLRTELGNKSVSVSFTPYLSRSSKSEVLSGKVILNVTLISLSLIIYCMKILIVQMEFIIRYLYHI